MLQVKFSRNFKLDPKGVRGVVYQVFNRTRSRGLKFLKRYPPQRNPNTTYERGFGVRPNQRISEDLGARWIADLIQSGSEIRIDFGNNASYAVYVQSLQYQAEIHQDWWQTDEEMIDRFLPEMENDIIKFLPSAIVQ